MLMIAQNRILSANRIVFTTKRSPGSPLFTRAVYELCSDCVVKSESRLLFIRSPLFISNGFCLFVCRAIAPTLRFNLKTKQKSAVIPIRRTMRGESQKYLQTDCCLLLLNVFGGTLSFLTLSFMRLGQPQCDIIIYLFRICQKSCKLKAFSVAIQVISIRDFSLSMILPQIYKYARRK